METETRGTLPPGGSSMRPGTQVKKIQVGQQKVPQPPTKDQDVPPIHPPVPGK